MKDLLDEGLEALSDLLQSGAGSVHPETEERLHRLSQTFEENGLHTGGTLLHQAAEALAARRHGVEGEALLSFVAPAARYIHLCQQKYALDAAGEQLLQSENEEETPCET